MMKFYKKKEISQEKTPILFRLERRHTVLDGGLHETTDEEPNRVSRSNSVGSYNCVTPNGKKRSATLSKLCMSDDTRSNSSSASTVVITESELSSSWLYKARKAKIDSDNENISQSPSIPTEDNDMQPVQLQDPKLKPVLVESKPRRQKVSSCCCYALVALTICFSSLAIMAAIGGIIYLEVFAAYREVMQSQHATPQTALVPALGRNVDLNGPSEKTFQNFEQHTSEEILNDKVNSDPKNKETLAEDTHRKNLDTAEGNIHVGGIVNDFNPGEQLNINSKIDQKSSYENVKHLSNEKLKENKFSSTPSLDVIESFNTDQSFTNEQVSVPDSKLNSFLENQDINHISKDNFDGLNTNDHFRLLETELEVSNDTSEGEVESLNISETESFLDDNNQKSKTVEESESQFRNILLDDDDDEDDSLVRNRPVVEARPPIEFLNRLIGNQNRDFNQLSIRDMDQKFSLAEILKHLRALDDNNRLSSSRQKDTVTETIKIPIHQDIGVERKEYLSNLRKKIYN